jgi:hypothetical protein
MDPSTTVENAEFWVETTDEKSGKTYYYHSVTFVAVWERPKEGLIVPESELVDEADVDDESSGATGGAPPLGAAQTPDAVTSQPDTAKTLASGAVPVAGFTSPIVSGSTGPLPHSPVVVGPTVDEPVLSPTPPNSSPPSRAASAHFGRLDGRSHPTVEISNANSVDSSPDRHGNHKTSSPFNLISPRDLKPSTPVELPFRVSFVPCLVCDVMVMRGACAGSA